MTYPTTLDPWLRLSVLRSAAAAAAKSLQSCPILCDPIDSSPPGSPVHGIFQARVLEWVAIAFSKVVSNSLQSVDCSMSGSSVLYYLPEFAQIYVPLVGDAIKFTSF